VWLSWFRSLNWFGLLTWLDQHSGAVTALVTTIYAIFTVLLWQATKRQATLTHRTFEASNRPYLSMRSQEDGPGTFSVLSFTVLIVPEAGHRQNAAAARHGRDGGVSRALGARISDYRRGAAHEVRSAAADNSNVT